MKSLYEKEVTDALKSIDESLGSIAESLSNLSGIATSLAPRKEIKSDILDDESDNSNWCEKINYVDYKDRDTKEDM